MELINVLGIIVGVFSIGVSGYLAHKKRYDDTLVLFTLGLMSILLAFR